MSREINFDSMIQELVERLQPESILQIGLSSSRSIHSLSRAIANHDGSLITLIEPQLYDRPEYDRILQELQDESLDKSIDFMATYADQVLPDLYFQELRFDLAILNPCRNYEETFVAFYYLNKMLPLNHYVVIEQANDPVMRRLIRHMVSESGYEVHANVESGMEMPKIERLIREQYARIPGFVRQRVEDFIRPEIVITNEELGITGSLIVLEKVQEDDVPVLGVDQMLEAFA